MTWTAAEITRIEAPYVGDERTILEAYLDFHRQTLLLKCAGLTGPQLKRAAVEPSNLTLLGLVRHMTEVEHWWFSVRSAGGPEAGIYCDDVHPDGDFDLVADADPVADLARYEAEIRTSKAAVAGLPLEYTFVHARREVEMSLRWVYVHMIEEYARHNGHADLLRERVDGATGA